MATAEYSTVTRQAAKLHHGYTRQQLKDLGAKHSRRDALDSLEIAAERRKWVLEEIEGIKDGDISAISFRYYFIWKQRYRSWLGIARRDLRVLPLP